MQDNTLIYKLQEYKNPIVIVAIGILLGFTSYYQNIHFGYFYFCLVTLLLIAICFRNKKLYGKRNARSSKTYIPDGIRND